MQGKGLAAPAAKRSPAPVISPFAAAAAAAQPDSPAAAAAITTAATKQPATAAAAAAAVPAQPSRALIPSCYLAHQAQVASARAALANSSSSTAKPAQGPAQIYKLSTKQQRPKNPPQQPAAAATQVSSSGTAQAQSKLTDSAQGESASQPAVAAFTGKAGNGVSDDDVAATTAVLAAAAAATAAAVTAAAAVAATQLQGEMPPNGGTAAAARRSPTPTREPVRSGKDVPGPQVPDVGSTKGEQANEAHKPQSPACVAAQLQHSPVAHAAAAGSVSASTQPLVGPAAALAARTAVWPPPSQPPAAGARRSPSPAPAAAALCVTPAASERTSTTTSQVSTGESGATLTGRHSLPTPQLSATAQALLRSQSHVHYYSVRMQKPTPDSPATGPTGTAVSMNARPSSGRPLVCKSLEFNPPARTGHEETVRVRQVQALHASPLADESNTQSNGYSKAANPVSALVNASLSSGLHRSIGGGVGVGVGAGVGVGGGVIKGVSLITVGSHVAEEGPLSRSPPLRASVTPRCMTMLRVASNRASGLATRGKRLRSHLGPHSITPPACTTCRQNGPCLRAGHTR